MNYNGAGVKEMSGKKRRRFYLPFIESPIPLFEMECWECGNRIIFGQDERGYYVEEARELVFEPPLEMKARLVEKPEEDKLSHNL